MSDVRIAERARPGRITVEEFQRMIERGLFDPDARIELVEGRLVSCAPPQGPLHAGAVFGIPEVIRARLGLRARLWAQLPIVLSDETQLEPDLALLRPRADGYRGGYPRVSDVVAVLEMGDSSLRYDRTRKLPLYARAGIPEYWIVDLRKERIEVYRKPHAVGYEDRRDATRGDTVAFAAFPDVAFAVDELLG